MRPPTKIAELIRNANQDAGSGARLDESPPAYAIETQALPPLDRAG